MSRHKQFDLFVSRNSDDYKYREFFRLDVKSDENLGLQEKSGEGKGACSAGDRAQADNFRSGRPNERDIEEVAPACVRAWVVLGVRISVCARML